jgi:hypothetical protein
MSTHPRAGVVAQCHLHGHRETHVEPLAGPDSMVVGIK